MSLGEHRARLEEQLMLLASQLEAVDGQGAAQLVAQALIPESNFLEAQLMRPRELADLIVETDLTQVRLTTQGNRGNHLLQSMCRTYNFQDRIQALVTVL